MSVIRACIDRFRTQQPLPAYLRDNSITENEFWWKNDDASKDNSDPLEPVDESLMQLSIQSIHPSLEGAEATALSGIMQVSSESVLSPVIGEDLNNNDDSVSNIIRIMREHDRIMKPLQGQAPEQSSGAMSVMQLVDEDGDEMEPVQRSTEPVPQASVAPYALLRLSVDSQVCTV